MSFRIRWWCSSNRWRKNRPTRRLCHLHSVEVLQVPRLSNAAQKGVRISKLVTTIDHNREHANLSSAIRLYVLDYAIFPEMSMANQKQPPGEPMTLSNVRAGRAGLNLSSSACSPS